MNSMKLLRQHPSKPDRRACVCAAFASACLPPATPARRARRQGVPNAMQGFSQNRDQPIQIEAASLEMRDKKKEATFSGNVKVVQGDTTMTSKILVVFYNSTDPAAGAGSQRQSRGQIGARYSRPPRAPAAVRRSDGWKPRAMWS